MKEDQVNHDTGEKSWESKAGVTPIPQEGADCGSTAQYIPPT